MLGLGDDISWSGEGLGVVRAEGWSRLARATGAVRVRTTSTPPSCRSDGRSAVGSRSASVGSAHIGGETGARGAKHIGRSDVAGQHGGCAVTTTSVPRSRDK